MTEESKTPEIESRYACIYATDRFLPMKEWKPFFVDKDTNDANLLKVNYHITILNDSDEAFCYVPKDLQGTNQKCLGIRVSEFDVLGSKTIAEIEHLTGYVTPEAKLVEAMDIGYFVYIDSDEVLDKVVIHFIINIGDHKLIDQDINQSQWLSVDEVANLALAQLRIKKEFLNVVLDPYSLKIATLLTNQSAFDKYVEELKLKRESYSYYKEIADNIQIGIGNVVKEVILTTKSEFKIVVKDQNDVLHEVAIPPKDIEFKSYEFDTELNGFIAIERDDLRGITIKWLTYNFSKWQVIAVTLDTPA